MSSIPQNHSNEKALVDCVQRFFSKHHVGQLLARCNGTKEKGVSPTTIYLWLISLTASKELSILLLKLLEC